MFFTDAALAGTKGFSLVCDRADVLAELVGAQLDERRLALELLTLGVPHPLSGSPMWKGVHALPGGYCLTLAP
ncbi:hypothetical protein [Streptomyces sp. NPDC056387]|uniref:hypothetical protein n=1 Tax=Streptomyces sp. NPDC056387 TaxID=3345803 RepID=UPI0035DA76D5